MNGSYFQNPTFPTREQPMNEGIPSSPPGNISSMGMMIQEQSYIENILRLNKGRRVNAYVSFPDSSEWQNKIFSGIIEEAGQDHLIISDPANSRYYLIRLIYLDYVEFMEKINYSHSYSEKNY